MESIWMDLKGAVRTLRKQPATTLVILLTLALGIGANGAIFSVINGVLLKPLDHREQEQLLLVTSQFPTLGFDRFWISPPEYFELQEWTTSFSAIGGYRSTDVSLVGPDQPIRVRAANVTATLFDVLGNPPLLGRTLEPEDDVPGAPPVAVLSYELWQGALGGDEQILGETFEINGQLMEIVGVMHPGFDVESERARIWLPLGLDPSNRNNRGSHFLNVVARLAPGETLASARAEMEVLLEGWNDRAGGGHTPSVDTHRMQLQPLRDEIVGDSRPALQALVIAVGLLLLIACANVANILLARSEARRKEMAIRTAAGAGRGRLLRQLLTESLLLSAVAGALGLFIARYGLRWVLARYPESLPRTEEVTLDTRVLLVTALVALGTGILFGLMPALRLSRVELGSILKEGGRTSDSVGALRGRNALVVVEVALAVGLVVGSGLMLRTLGNLLRQDVGFEVSDLVTFDLYLAPTTYPDGQSMASTFDRLLESIGEIPGVVEVTAASGLPPLRDINANTMVFEGIEPTDDGPPQNMDYFQFVTDGYFDAMGIRFLAGRDFLASDDGESAPVVLVNQKAAQTWWPDQDPIGRRLRQPGDSSPWLQIVGVVEDVKQAGLDSEVGTELYFRYNQVAQIVGPPRTMNVLVRSTLELSALSQQLRSRVWAIDPALPIANLRPMTDVMETSVARTRLLTLLLSSFGTMALFLAAIGIYGLLAYTVSSRTQEIGVRMAMGAASAAILRLILGRGLALTLSGLVLGILGSIVVSRALGSLLYGVGRADTTTYAGVVALLLAVALVACVLPALRALRVDPLEALRGE